jgi:hypothetical protein
MSASVGDMILVAVFAAGWAFGLGWSRGYLAGYKYCYWIYKGRKWPEPGDEE